MDPEFDPDTTSYETETANASDTLTLTPEGTSTTVEVRFYESEPDGWSVENPEGEYTLTWDFTDSDENYIQIVATSEAVEASTWITVAQTTGGPRLATLGLTGLTLTPEFDPDVFQYETSTENATDTLALTVPEDFDFETYGVIAWQFPADTVIPDGTTTDEFLDLTDELQAVPIQIGEQGTGTITWDGSAVIAAVILNNTQSGGSEPIVAYTIDVTVS